MEKTVKVIAIESNEVLYQTTIDQIESAYAKATEFEELGIEVKIKSPSLPETLATSLGHQEQELTELREEIESEIDAHNCPKC